MRTISLPPFQLKKLGLVAQPLSNLSVPLQKKVMKAIFAVLAAAACFLACAHAATTKEGLDFLEVGIEKKVFKVMY
jgi:hypothetical protein